MKNLNDASNPRPSDASNSRPPRRRVNPAKAGVAVAVAALLGLFGFAGLLHQAWSRPMPLAHKTVTVTSALPALSSTPLTVTGPQTPNEVNQVTFGASSTYAGVPILATANTAQSMRLALPSGVTAQPAGEQVEIGPVFVFPGGLSWRSEPGTSATEFSLPQDWNGYASWFLSFSKPGTYRVPVAIGSQTSNATIHVLPLPSGANFSVHAVPAQHPELQISNPASVPIRVEGAGLPSTLTPGQVITTTPGASYTVLAPPTQGTSGAVFQFEIRHYHGSVSYSGTLTTHHRISFRPPHPPFRLPSWWLIALILAALLLAVSGVGAARGVRDGLGGKGQGATGTGTAGK